MKPVLIWDAQGNVRYTLEREKTLKFGYRLILRDMHGDEAAAIRQKLAALSSTFLVQIHGRELTVCLKHTLQIAMYTT